MALTAKQQKFVDEYMIDCNATQAAIRAGYSKKNAKNIGNQLLGKTTLSEAILRAQKKARKRSVLTVDRVLAEYKAIAFSNINDYLTYNASGVALNDSANLRRNVASAIAEVSESVGPFGSAVKFKLHNKIAALDAICRILGFDGKTQENKSLPTIKIEIEDKPL